MKRVLVCALDWGLGHAARCIPVIKALQLHGAEVFLASSGSAGELLKQEFPRLSYHNLPGYQPRYHRRGSLAGALAFQVPHFLHTIRMEHEETEALVGSLRLDAIISDNRYGCYSDKVKSVILTHQSHVHLPGLWGFFDPFVNLRLHTYIKRYHQVWVPDQPGSGLSELFMDDRTPFAYVGWLSRFPIRQEEALPSQLMVILSGPEPQRMILEQLLRPQLISFPGTVTLVTGQPSELTRVKIGNLEVFNHLPTDEMERRIRGAEWVIARSGYSTIMDLIALGKKAVFIPTPGQPEQIALADFLMRNRIAFCCDQRNFVLGKALAEAGSYTGLGGLSQMSGLLDKEIINLLA